MVSLSKDLIEQVNDAMDDPMSENISTKYYEPYEVRPLMKNTSNHMSFFLLNISSFCFHIEELTTPISEHGLAFDITGKGKCWLELITALLNSVQILRHNFEFIPTEWRHCTIHTKGLNYKVRNCIQIYQSKQLESIFIQTTQDKQHIVVGCIHRHNPMELGEFNSDYLPKLLEKPSFKNKTLVLYTWRF